MKPLRVFYPNLELLAEIDDYESMAVTRRWHTYGEISLTVHQDKQHADKLLNGNILLPGTDYHSAAVIRYRQTELDTLTIRAPFLGSFMAQRVIVPVTLTGAAETVMKELVDRQAANPVVPARTIPLLTIAPDLERGQVLTLYAHYENLAEVLEEISRGSGLGWGVYLTESGFVFEVYEGTDHTVTGQEPVIFSPDFDNVMQQTLIESQFEEKNAIYVERDGTVVAVGEGEGAERFELYATAPSEGSLEDAARQLLQDGIFSLEAEAIGGSFVYRQDYDLGDIVTVQNKRWGVERSARITEVQEVYEPNNMQVYLTFGDSPPTIIDKVKQEFKRMGGV